MRFEVLGPLRVRRGDADVPIRAGTQRRVLAAFLTRAGGHISLTELIDALWPNEPPARAGRNVQSYVAKLRQTLEGEDRDNPDRAIVVSTPGGYALRLGPGDLDAREFAENVRRAQEAHGAGDDSTAGVLVDRALRLWRGRPYGDLHEWAFLQSEIARLDQVRLQAFELGLELGRHADLLPELSACVEENPYQEQVVGLTMRALYAGGRQADAQELYRRTRARLVDNLGIEPTTELQRLHRAQLQGEPAPTGPSRPPARVVLVDGMPARPKVFQQRDRELGALHTMSLSSTSVVSLIGPRGVGKTQLAAAYARTRIAQGWNVIWIDAESRERLLSGLTHLADTLDLRPTETDSEYTARRIRRWFSQLEAPGLLVFDNATDPDLIREWLPATGSVQTIVTTNRRVFGWLGERIEVGTFTSQQAQEFLESSTGIPGDEHTDRIVDAVGGFPLALALSAAVIGSEHLTYDDYLQRLNALPVGTVLAAHEADPYPGSVADAIHLSLFSVEEHEPEARWLIELTAVLSSTGTSRSLLVPDDSDVHKRALRSRVLGMLVDASLVNRSQEGGVLLMHRLTRRVVIERAAGESRLGPVVSEATRLLDNRFHTSSADPRAVDEVLQHTESLLEIAESHRLGPDETNRLLELGSAVIEHYHGIFNSVRVNPLNRAVLALQETTLAPNDPAVLRSRNNLAREFRQQGRVDDAISTLESILAVQRERLGPDDPDTLRTRYDLASTHLMRGLSNQAITMLEQVADDNERALGATHTRTLLARKRLAWAHRSIGRLESANLAYDGVLEIFEQSYGPGHPLTLRTRSELACVHRSQGRLDEASHLLEQTIGRREQAFGADHPDSIHDRDRLAGVYRAMGRHDEAVRLFQETSVEYERTLGDGHPWTLNARNNLGCALDAAHRPEEAIPLLRQALADHERVLGPRLPRTSNVRNNVACALFHAGHREEAASLLEQTLADREGVLGPDHPDTRTSVHNLAVASGSERRLPVDELWQRQAYAYGTGHGTEETIVLGP